MKQNRFLKSRRTFLFAGLFTGGAVLIGAGLNYKYKPRSRIIARQLINYLQTHHLANITGASLIASDKSLQGLSLDQLIDKVLADVSLNRSDFSLLKSTSQLDRFQHQLRQDFTNENIVLVNGWFLSTTEAHLCALLHRYHNPLT